MARGEPVRAGAAAAAAAAAADLVISPFFQEVVDLQIVSDFYPLSVVSTRKKKKKLQYRFKDHYKDPL